MSFRVGGQQLLLTSRPIADFERIDQRALPTVDTQYEVVDVEPGHKLPVAADHSNVDPHRVACI